MKVVLDSWAVLRLLEGSQPVALRVEQRMSEEPRPVMNWINAGEVFYITRRSAGDRVAKTVIRDLRSSVALETPSDRRVIEAARIKSDHSMAYADAFAAATAIAHGATLWTGDPELLVDRARWRWEDLRTGQS